MKMGLFLVGRFVLFGGRAASEFALALAQRRIPSMEAKIVEGDLLDQNVECIVNAWNQNFIPWWLLLPHGVSGAIKKRGGYEPFWEIGRNGPMALGAAVKTSAGKLPFKCIIHVAAINVFWCATEKGIRSSVENAMKIAEANEIKSIAFPILGSGTGGFNPAKAEAIMLEELVRLTLPIEVTLVRFKQGR